jgi:hypothetical protein
MTFSILLVKDHKPRVVGTLWADDETKARALAPVLYGSQGEQVEVCRTEDREIPLRVSAPEPMNFC